MTARSTSSILVAACALLTLAATARAEPPGAAGPAAPVSLVGDGPGAPAAEGSAPPTLVTPIAVAPPLLVAPSPGKPDRVRLATRWWFWAALGGAAVGVVLAAIFVRPRDPYVGNANPGTVTIF